MSDNKMDIDEEIDDEFNDEDIPIKGPENGASNGAPNGAPNGTDTEDTNVNFGLPDLPELARKDKTLKEVLELMEGDYAPIIPDAVTDYYLAKNGFESSDVKIKRLLALATQKFISDVAQDAYEYSRIRNSSAVYNSSNPQARAKQLLQSQQFANQQKIPGSTSAEGDAPQQHSTGSSANQQGKVVLTMEDLSSALSEYGVNSTRPDFYR